MGLAESLFALWVSLGSNQVMQLPPEWIPEEAGQASLKKVSEKISADGQTPVTAMSTRIWDEEAGPAKCLIQLDDAQAAASILVVRQGMEVQDINLFNLAHELGHCADRRRANLQATPEDKARTLMQREVFASGFAACIMSKAGKHSAARDIAESLKKTMKGSLGFDQHKAMMFALRNPVCYRNQPTALAGIAVERRDFEDAWKVASATDFGLYGEASREVSFETFMLRRSEKEQSKNTALAAQSALKDPKAE